MGGTNVAGDGQALRRQRPRMKLDWLVKANDQESGSPIDDLTPEVGAATDVAPLGRSDPKPPHELTAAEDSDPVDWGRRTCTNN